MLCRVPLWCQFLVGITLSVQPCSAFTPADKTELKAALSSWNANAGTAGATYGEVGTWVVAAMTDFGALLQDLTNINEDLTGWDTSSVTRMYRMLRNASAFNQPCGWDTSGVTNMQGDRLV